MLPPPEEREWWEWHASARNAGGPEAAKNEYELGLKWIPHSAPLIACYAHFLTRTNPASGEIAKLVTRAKEIIELLDAKSPEVLSVLHQFGRISQLGGDLEEAADYFDKVLAGRRMVLGSAHPDTQASIQNLAEVFLQLHRDEKAEALYSEYNSLLRDRFGEDHNYYKADCQRLAKIRLEIRNSGKSHSLSTHKKKSSKQKRIVIHQPHFLPWLGYFNKLVNCSHFVVLDNVNFRERYFQNRTRVRDSSFDFTWLTLPTHASMHDLLLDVRISESDWKNHITESLRHAYRRGRYFDETWASFVNWLPPLGNELVSVNVGLIQSVLKHLGYGQIEISLGREHEGEYGQLLEGYSISERTNELRRTLKVAAICRSIGANELIFGEGGGRECHNLDLLRRYGIQIVQQRFANGFPGYRDVGRKKDVGRKNIEGVSIVDALFLIGRQQTLDLLRQSWTPHLG
jgi:tetratricopeptide (TPR) repeat protein